MMNIRTKASRRRHVNALPCHRPRRLSEPCDEEGESPHWSRSLSRLDQVQPTSHLLDDSIPSASADGRGVEHESTPIINEYDLPSGGSDVRYVEQALTS